MAIKLTHSEYQANRGETVSVQLRYGKDDEIMTYIKSQSRKFEGFSRFFRAMVSDRMEQEQSGLSYDDLVKENERLQSECKCLLSKFEALSKENDRLNEAYSKTATAVSEGQVTMEEVEKALTESTKPKRKPRKKSE